MRQLIRQVTRDVELYFQEMDGVVTLLANEPNIESFFGPERVARLFGA